MRSATRTVSLAICWFIGLAWLGPVAALADTVQFTLTNAGAYGFAVLYEGNGGHTLTINTNSNGQQYSVNGNVGLGDPNGSVPALNVNNPGSLNGNALFAGTVNNTSNGTITGTVTGNKASVTTALNAVNTVSSTLGGESGKALILNPDSMTLHTQTVEANTGTLDTNNNYVFNVSSLSFSNGSTIIVDGAGMATGSDVVFNINFDTHFAGTIDLTGGLSSDQVIWNMYGGNAMTLSGGDTLQTAANKADITGTFLDPNGTININDVFLNGRLFGGDSSDMMIVSGAYVNAPPTPVPGPTLPFPSAFLAGGFLLLTMFTAGRRFGLRTF